MVRLEEKRFCNDCENQYDIGADFESGELMDKAEICPFCGSSDTEEIEEENKLLLEDDFPEDLTGDGC